LHAFWSISRPFARQRRDRGVNACEMVACDQAPTRGTANRRSPIADRRIGRIAGSPDRRSVRERRPESPLSNPASQNSP
jgi:hypothetical protein